MSATENPRAHGVAFIWEGETPEASIVCPYDPADLTRPCLMRDGDYGEGDPMPESGCAVIEYLDAGGYESIGIVGKIEAAAMVDVGWNPEGWPILTQTERES